MGDPITLTNINQDFIFGVICGVIVGIFLMSWRYRKMLNFREWYLAAFIWECWKKKGLQRTVKEWQEVSKNNYTPKEVLRAFHAVVEKDPFYKTKEDLVNGSTKNKS